MPPSCDRLKSPDEVTYFFDHQFFIQTTSGKHNPITLPS